MLNKAVLWDLSYGVYIVSSMDENRPVGCVANCAVQLTQNLIAVSLNHQNYTNTVIKKNKDFALSILSNNSDSNIISVFGFSSGRDKNKFDEISYKVIDNLPIIDDAKGYITLHTVQEVELDTHTLFIAEITGGDVFNDDIPMTYKYYHDVIKGRAPQNAPTYIDPESIKQLGDDKKDIKYRCSICGYIYEGDITKEDENFVCPVCKQPKSVFIEVK